MRRLATAVLAVILLAAAAAAAAPAAVRAWLSANETSFGQPVTLTLEADGQSTAPPDLSALEADFQIVDRRTQHSVSTINGRRSERTGLTLVLLPRRPGTLRVPPVPFGEQQSPALTLSVTGEASALAPTPLPSGSAPAAAPQQSAERPAATAPEVRVEADLDPPRVRVRQQAVLTARVLAEGPVHAAGLRDPQVPGARVVPLGEDRYPLQRDGRDWQVYERRWSLFPESPGAIEIGPIAFAGMVGSNAGGGFGQAESRLLGLTVRPLPAGADEAQWLPARAVTLSETSPEVSRVRPGQTLERVITLTVDGLPAGELPRLGLNLPFQFQRIDTEPTLWDRREPHGIIGTRVDRVLITPREEGVFRLPEERIAWWNTRTGTAESAVLPAREVEVAAFARPEDRGTLGTGSLRTAGPGAAAPAQPDRGDSPGGEPATEETAAVVNPWFWISLALAAALAFTVVAGRRRARAPVEPRPRDDHPAPDPDPTLHPSPADPLEQSIEDVRAAYAAGNVTAARDALLAWGARLMPDAPASNLARLAQRCPEPLRGEILLLEQAFFSPAPVAWEQKPVWTRLRGLTPLPPEEPASHRRTRPLKRNIAGRGTS